MDFDFSLFTKASLICLLALDLGDNCLIGNFLLCVKRESYCFYGNLNLIINPNSWLRNFETLYYKVYKVSVLSAIEQSANQ